MQRPGSSVARSKQAKVGPQLKGAKKQQVVLPTIQDLVESQDYAALTKLMECERKYNGREDKTTILWLAYGAFHNGDYKKAMGIYEEMMKKPSLVGDVDYRVYKACCLFGLCLYKEAREECIKADDSPLKYRMMFHLAHKLQDENSLMSYHDKLSDTIPDQLCLASLHYLRSHWEESTEVYKKLLMENRDFHALNVYIALCYYQLDYFDVALEILSSYLSVDPNSVIACNLKGCITAQLYNGKTAEDELRPLTKAAESGNLFQDSDLLRHNQVVFRSGENALQVLPPLVDIIPEAKINLAIYNIKNEEIEEAYKLIKDMDPVTPKEYILKAIVHSIIGQATESSEHIKIAQQLFQLVGGSANECDTIPGRQCMASCFFLLKQFDDVLVYLRSIRDFFLTDDDFNWNYGIALAASGEYKDAEEALLVIKEEKYRSEYTFISWLCRCYIMNGKPSLAWDYHQNLQGTSEGLNLLSIIANDCYKMGHFYYSCKAFDLLERLEPDPEFWEGKRGAAVGVFQMVVAGKEMKEKLKEVLELLKFSSNPQVEYIIKVIRKWGRDNGLKI